MYFKYEPEKLLPFLKSSHSYNIVDTLNFCREKGLTAELIYLYDKLGDKKTTLGLLLQGNRPIKDACRYIIEKEPGNQELWNEITEVCGKEKAKFIELFEYLEYFADPVLGAEYF